MDEPIEIFRLESVPATTSKWYEMREAARFALYRWDEFRELSPDDQAGVIAHYRAHNKLAALIDKYQADRAKARAAADKSKAKGRIR